ncbi:MAG: ABC transporter permease subunit [Bacillota bacterium]|nr:ABC transporter permease subunit [Bacillota bacterium]
MINWVLFKRELKNSLKLFLIFLAILFLYAGMVTAMFDPAVGDSLNKMAEGMPQLFAAFGMANVGATLLEFCINYLYNFIFVALPAVFIIILANRLVVSYVEKGSMAYLLSTPNTRKVIAGTQLRVISLLVFILTALTALFTWYMAEYFFPGQLEQEKFILLNVALFGLLFFLTGLCFCTSCIFNEAKLSYTIGGGLVVVFTLLDMLSQIGDKFEFLKYATPFTLFNTEAIATGNSEAIWMFLILYLGGIVFSFIGIQIFAKKDMPL